MCVEFLREVHICRRNAGKESSLVTKVPLTYIYIKYKCFMCVELNEKCRYVGICREKSRLW